MSFDWSIVAYGAPIFFFGALNTLSFCALAIAAGLVLGLGLALGRLSQRTMLRLSTTVFVEIVRNHPFLVQGDLLLYALPALGIRLGAEVAGILALSAYAAAYFSEAIRGAILSVPRGQSESARALGLPYPRTLRRIVAPQMMG